MQNNLLSKTELEIMEYFWSNNKEITSNDLRIHFHDKNWSKQTVHTFIKRLLKSGLIKARKISVNKYCYSAKISKEEYNLMPAKDVLETIYKGSLKDFVCALLHPDIQQDEIVELYKILDEYKKRYENKPSE